MIAKTTTNRKLTEHRKKLDALREMIRYNNDDEDFDAMKKNTRLAVDENREIARCEKILLALGSFSDRSQYDDLVKLMTQMNRRLSQTKGSQDIDSFLTSMESNFDEFSSVDEELELLGDLLPESNVLQYKKKFHKPQE